MRARRRALAEPAAFALSGGEPVAQLERLEASLVEMA